MWIPCHFLWIPWIYSFTWRLHHGPIQSPDYPRLAQTPESQGNSTLPQFCQLLPSFHLWILQNHHSLTCLTCNGTPWHFSNEFHSAFEALKRLSPQLQSLPTGSQTLSSQSRLMPLTMHLPQSFDHNSEWQTAPHCIPLLTFSTLELNYNMHDKELLALFEAFKWWQQGSALQSMWPPITIISMTKILMHWQAHWSEYLSGFNLVICFCPGKLGTKPNTLTRWWDVYLKEGIVTMPVPTHRTYASIHWVTGMIPPSYYPNHPALHGYLIMDAERLCSNIWTQLWEDPISEEHLNNQSKALNKLQVKQVIPRENLHLTLGLGGPLAQGTQHLFVDWVMVLHFLCMVPFQVSTFWHRSGHSDSWAQVGTHVNVVHKICPGAPCCLIFRLQCDSLVRVSSISALACNLSPTLKCPSHTTTGWLPIYHWAHRTCKESLQPAQHPHTFNTSASQIEGTGSANEKALGAFHFNC